MANEPVRPGVPGGLDAIITNTYGVPARPTLNREDAARRVREKVKTLGCERLDVSEEPVRRGALVDMSGARVSFPEGKTYDRCYVALVDPAMDAQWGHAAFWAFVPAAGDGDVILRPTQFPEHALGVVTMSRVPIS